MCWLSQLWEWARAAAKHPTMPRILLLRHQQCEDWDGLKTDENREKKKKKLVCRVLTLGVSVPKFGQQATPPLPLTPVHQTLQLLTHLSVFLELRYKMRWLCWFCLNDLKDIMLYLMFGDIFFLLQTMLLRFICVCGQLHSLPFWLLYTIPFINRLQFILMNIQAVCTYLLLLAAVLQTSYI